MASLPNGWKGSHGLEGSAVPDMLTGVLLPEDIKNREESLYYHKLFHLCGEEDMREATKKKYKNRATIAGLFRSLISSSPEEDATGTKYLCSLIADRYCDSSLQLITRDLI